MLTHRHPRLAVAVHHGEGFGDRYSIAPALRLPVSRIGHALQLVNEPVVRETVRTRGITVEASPISNFLLGRISDLSEHPLPRLMNAGVKACLGTDNPGVLGSRLTDEFYVAVAKMGLGWRHLVELTSNSIDSSFAPDCIKRDLQRDQSVALTDFLSTFMRRDRRRDLDALNVAPSPFAQRYLDQT